MHDRLDHYDEKPLTEHELQQLRWKEAGPDFKTFPVICINPKGKLGLRFGVTYDVIGEEYECWRLAETGDIPDVPYAKDRFCTPGEWVMWLYEREAYHQGQAARHRAMRDAEEPDGRF